MLGVSDKNNYMGLNRGNVGYDKGEVVPRGIPSGQREMKGRAGKENIRSVNEGRGLLGRDNISQGSLEVGMSSGSVGEGLKSGVVSEYLARLKELGEKKLYNIKNKPPDISIDRGESGIGVVVPRSRVSSPVKGGDNFSMCVD